MKTATEEFYNDKINFRNFDTVIPITNWNSKVEFALIDVKGKKLMSKVDTMSEFCPASKESEKKFYDTNEDGEEEKWFEFYN